MWYQKVKSLANQVQPIFRIPVIDLKGIHEDDVRRREIVEQMCKASETWGFFQVVNHGISKNVMEGMVEGVKGFHEEKRMK